MRHPQQPFSICRPDRISMMLDRSLGYEPRRFEPNVRAGAAVLDRRFPDWRRNLVPELLEMHDNSRCVLGQLFGEQETGLKVLFRTNREEQAVTYGFALPDDQANVHLFVQLSKEWLLQLVPSTSSYSLAAIGA